MFSVLRTKGSQTSKIFDFFEYTVLVRVAVQPTLRHSNPLLRCSDALASTAVVRLQRVVFVDQLHLDARVMALVLDICVARLCRLAGWHGVRLVARISYSSKPGVSE